MLPCYNTILYSIRPSVYRVCYVQHEFIQEKINVNAPGVTTLIRTRAEAGETPFSTLLITLLSSWVYRDAETLKRDMTQEIQLTSRRPNVCSFFNSEFQNYGRDINSYALLCEMRLHDGFYEYGSFLRLGDFIQEHFTVSDRNFRSFLIEHGIACVGGSLLTLNGIIGQSAIIKDGKLGNGLGDIPVILQTELHIMRELSMRYRVIGSAGGCTSCLYMSPTGFHSQNARLNAVSLLSRSTNSPRVAPPFGVLRDGRRYIRVPYVLFTDDFSSMGGRGGSSGGCYLAPLITPMYGRRTMDCVRVLGLTAPGVSSNAVLRHIVSDVVRCAVKGVEITESDGGKLIMFAEIVAYVGDYPGMVHCLDLLGQNGNAPCTHCTFIRTDLTTEEECSRYGYTASINSADASFKRTKERMRTIREAPDTSDANLNDVGLKRLSAEEIAKLPLHLLSDKLQDAQPRIPLTRDLVPVVQTVFDPYQSYIIAPSHVLYGLAKNILEANIRMCSPLQRKQVDSLIFRVLSSCGSTSEHSLINVEKAKLNNATISNTFAVLIIAPWAFRTVLYLDHSVVSDRPEDTHELLLHALYKFRELYAEATFIPLKERDGAQAMESMNDSQSYFSFLKGLCVRYVDLANQLCGLSPDLRMQLDKPNLHRMVELFHHSVPRLGHVSVLDELMFEATHQPLKRALQQSNHREGHIHSMCSVLANEWRGRLGHVCSSIPVGADLSQQQCKELMTACFGDSSALDTGVVSVDDVKSSFKPEVMHELRNYVRGRHRTKLLTPVWTVRRSGLRTRTSSTSPPCLSSRLGDYTSTVAACNYINNLAPPPAVAPNAGHCRISRPRVQSFTNAIRCMVDASTYNGAKEFLAKGAGRVKKYNTLSDGDSLQVLVPMSPGELSIMLSQSGVHLLPTAANPGNTTYWVVMGIYKSRGSPLVYAHVRALILCDSHGQTGSQETEDHRSLEPIYRVDTGPAVILVRLDEHCTRALLLHCCCESHGCSCKATSVTTRLDSTGESIMSTVGDGRWTVIGSRQGYPPRTG